MSFASDIRGELAQLVIEKDDELLAEISGFLRVSSSISLLGGGKVGINVTTSSPAVARRYKKLIEDYFSINLSVKITYVGNFNRGYVYTLFIDHNMRSDAILRETGLMLVKQGNNFFTDGIYFPIVRSKRCKRAYLRGLFMGAGTMTDPSKSYHLEWKLSSPIIAEDVRKLIGTFTDLSASIVHRKDGYIVYVKRYEYISDILAMIGAYQAVMILENIQIEKSLVGKATRMANCDAANTDRTIIASQQLLQAIEKIEHNIGMEKLPPKLQEACEVRKKHPSATLSELGAYFDPPLKKGGVKARMDKILMVAKEI